MKENLEDYGTRYEKYKEAVKSTGVHLLENDSVSLHFWGTAGKSHRSGDPSVLLQPGEEGGAAGFTDFRESRSI